MNGLFGQNIPDMQTMYPQGAAPQSWNNVPQMPMGQPPQQMPAPMPVMEGSPDQTELPRYVGNPIVDKYMHMFLGAA